MTPQPHDVNTAAGEELDRLAILVGIVRMGGEPDAGLRGRCLYYLRNGDIAEAMRALGTQPEIPPEPQVTKGILIECSTCKHINTEVLTREKLGLCRLGEDPSREVEHSGGIDHAIHGTDCPFWASAFPGTCGVRRPESAVAVKARRAREGW